MLEANHKSNYQNFCKAIDNNAKVVICDNTNMKHEYFLNYIQYAATHGYIISIVE